MEELSKRKQKILRALVDEFVSTAEPVSSGDIKAKYMPEVSSATIRNDLAALEKWVISSSRTRPREEYLFRRRTSFTWKTSFPIAFLRRPR